ncbi:MAG: hypothetical protein AAF329_08070 [Cyanobacteria bacterium P01_A01_bin.17]
MNPPSEELEQRSPVWDALSELFLDTERQPYNHQWIANTLAESDYTEEELERILRHEVAPILGTNLLSVAGEWQGFDQNWLVTQILQRSQSRLCLPSITGALIVRSDEWKWIVRLVRAKRAELERGFD